MFKIFKASNPERGFRNVIESCLNDNPDFMIAKAELDDFNDGSKIYVRPGECAVFTINGQVAEVIEPSNKAVKVSNYVFFSNFRAMFYNGSRANKCSVYFVRTGRRQKNFLWGTPGSETFIDKTMGNTRYKAGGNGSFNITIDKENVVNFFNSVSIGTNGYFTYEQLEELIQAKIVQSFKQAIIEEKERTGSSDEVNTFSLSSNMERLLSTYFSDEYGLNLNLFTVDHLEMEDMPERADYRTRMTSLIVDKEITTQNQDLEDRGERMAIVRKAIEEKTIREAIAEGKLAELQKLGDQFWKIRLSELAETALSNPALANIGTTALGGYLGTHSNIIGDIVGAIGNLTKNNPSYSDQSGSSSTNSNASDTSSDFWGVQMSAQTPPEPESQTTNASDSEKMEMIKMYTQLLVTKKITQEQYDNLINNL